MNARASKSDLQVRLARRLLQLIVDGDLRPGNHLRELDLSERFAVSRTPVRATLGFLEGLGALEKVANKGFFLKANGPTALKIIEKLPVEDDEKIKGQIRKDWFDRKFEKEVSEGEIRARYDLGKMTATRVLAALAEEGIISRMPGYGWQFEPTLNTMSAHDESYDFRMLIEPRAILSKAFELDSAKAASLRTRHEQVLKNTHNPAVGEIIRLDEEFHEFLAQCSGNRYIAQAIVHQNRLRRLMEYHTLMDTGRFTASCLEHLEILDHLEAGEQQKAADIMWTHLQRAKDAAPQFDQDA